MTTKDLNRIAETAEQARCVGEKAKETWATRNVPWSPSATLRTRTQKRTNDSATPRPRCAPSSPCARNPISSGQT